MTYVDKIKSQRGFTIIETVVVIAVFLVILAGLLSLYINYQRVYNAQQATARVITASSLTGSELQSDAKQASEIVVSHNFSGTIYTTDAGTLVLRMPAINSSGTIIVNEYDYVPFYVDGSKLYKRMLVSANSSRDNITKQLSDTISTISFIYNDADLSQADKIDIDILMQVTVGRSTMEHRLQQSLYLRNQ